MSTDATRKIATLRKWSKNPGFINPSYLLDIADEFERVFEIMKARAEVIRKLHAVAPRHANGAPMFNETGMMLDENSNRSIFDDVDE